MIEHTFQQDIELARVSLCIKIGLIFYQTSISASIFMPEMRLMREILHPVWLFIPLQFLTLDFNEWEGVELF